MHRLWLPSALCGSQEVRCRPTTFKTGFAMGSSVKAYDPPPPEPRTEQQVKRATEIDRANNPYNDATTDLLETGRGAPRADLNGDCQPDVGVNVEDPAERPRQTRSGSAAKRGFRPMWEVVSCDGRTNRLPAIEIE